MRCIYKFGDKNLYCALLKKALGRQQQIANVLLPLEWKTEQQAKNDKSFSVEQGAD
jgi:hypothetical protein